MTQGLIMKALSGFYYVAPEENPGQLLACRARGVFRKRGMTPLVGDRVEVEEDTVTRILPRKNELLRPPAANLDLAVMVVAAIQPSPSPLVLDKLIAVCEYKQIEPVLVMTKTDLSDGREFASIYERAGFRVLFSGEEEPGTEEILSVLRGKTSIFVGNSGVGKSTLMNRLFPGLSRAAAAHRRHQRQAGPGTPHHPSCGAVSHSRGRLCGGHAWLFYGGVGEVCAHPQGGAGPLLPGIQFL